ncbi:hypothetical protein DPMN_003367, partial [Dreissena polymorpha]
MMAATATDSPYGGMHICTSNLHKQTELANIINEPCCGKMELNARTRIVVPYSSAQCAQTYRDNTFLFK